MFERLKEKFGFLYKSWVLGVLTVGYILGELGHYLIGVTSKQTAIDLDYGDHACQLNVSIFHRSELPTQCNTIMDETPYVTLSDRPSRAFDPLQCLCSN